MSRRPTVNKFVAQAGHHFWFIVALSFPHTNHLRQGRRRRRRRRQERSVIGSRRPSPQGTSRDRRRSGTGPGRAFDNHRLASTTVTLASVKGLILYVKGLHPCHIRRSRCRRSRGRHSVTKITILMIQTALAKRGIVKSHWERSRNTVIL
jgi:hypothetical protein